MFSDIKTYYDAKNEYCIKDYDFPAVFFTFLYLICRERSYPLNNGSRSIGIALVAEHTDEFPLPITKLCLKSFYFIVFRSTQV